MLAHHHIPIWPLNYHLALSLPSTSTASFPGLLPARLAFEPVCLCALLHIHSLLHAAPRGSVQGKGHCLLTVLRMKVKITGMVYRSWLLSSLILDFGPPFDYMQTALAFFFSPPHPHPIYPSLTTGPLHVLGWLPWTLPPSPALPAPSFRSTLPSVILWLVQVQELLATGPWEV